VLPSAERGTTSTSAGLPGQQPLSAFDSIGRDAIKPKQVWLAVTLALVSGPLGLVYSTRAGAVVMLIVGIVLDYWLGSISMLITLPVCALWAWRAARLDASMFD